MVDIMVVHDAATFPGIVLTCRIIGVLQIEQKSKGKTERNDRLFAVPRRSHSEQGLRDIRDSSGRARSEDRTLAISWAITRSRSSRGSRRSDGMDGGPIPS